MLYSLLPTLLFTLSSSLTPGPNNLMLMSSGLNFGVRRSIGHLLGILIGFTIMMLLVSFGFAVIFQQFTWLKTVLQVVGSIYMVYLAWSIYQSSSLETKNMAQPMTFMQALLFQWVNPKAWVMSVAAVSIYTVSPDYYINGLLLTALFFVCVLLSLVLWLALGVMLQQVITNPRARHQFNTVMAVLLLASIFLMYID